MAPEFRALVSLHHGIHNKSGANLSSSGWQPAELPVDQLVNHIAGGKAWVGCTLGDGRRCEESAGPANLIVLDIDGDLTLAEFWAKPFAQRHCVFTITSCSHLQATEKNPEALERFRAVFACETHDDVALHTAIYHLMLSCLGLTLVDNSGEKPERLWFGNDQAIIQFGAMALLPWDLIEGARELKSQQAVSHAAAIDTVVDDQDLARCDYVLRNLLPASAHGGGDLGYNDYWQVVLNAAASAGDVLHDAFVQWSSTGDHGKEERLNSRRWRGAGRKSTPLKILALARQLLGEGWWRQLPKHLWYGAAGRTVPVPILSVAIPIEKIHSQSIAAPDPGGSVSFPPKASTVAADQPEAPLLDISPANFEAARRSMEASKAAAGASVPGQNLAARIGELIALIYHLKVEGIHKLPEGDFLLTEAEADNQVDEYISELMTHQVFNRNPEKITSKLIAYFREQHGVEVRSKRNLRPEGLFDDGNIEPTPLIPGLISEGCSYILYAKQGAGKTTFALLLARAALATPGHNRFLDFEPVPSRYWKQSRVLYIASDGDIQAKGDLKRYAERLKQQNEEWANKQLRIISATTVNKATRWRIDLYEMHNLALTLDEAKEAGTPYRLVIIDSLKAVLPGGVRVGQQEITEYVELVDSICLPRGVAVLYIHHQSKESDTAQGAAGLLEMVHGVFRLKKNDDGQHLFCVDKTRLDPRGSREIPYKIDNQGPLKVAAHAEQPDDLDGRIMIAAAFQDHWQKHQMRVAHLPLTALEREYKGIPKSDYLLYLRSLGYRHDAWRTQRALFDIIGGMVKRGELRRLKNQQVAIAGSEGFTTITSTQLQLKQTEEPAPAGDDDDDLGDLGELTVPGW